MKIFRFLAGTFALTFFAACGPKKMSDVASKDNSSQFVTAGNGKAWSASVGAKSKYCVKFSTEPNGCVVMRYTADANDKLVLKDSGKGTCGLKGSSITGKYLSLGCVSETGESCLNSTPTG
jgi:hypothetical protein